MNAAPTPSTKPNEIRGNESPDFHMDDLLKQLSALVESDPSQRPQIEMGEYIVFGIHSLNFLLQVINQSLSKLNTNRQTYFGGSLMLFTVLRVVQDYQ